MTDPEPTRPDLPRLNLAGQAGTRAAAPATEANRPGGQRQARTTGWRPVAGWRVPGLAGWRTPQGTLSARASLIGMFAVFLLGDLTAGSLHLAGLAGFGFAAGSAAAAGWTRRQDLLAVATTPPVLFLAAVSCGELVTMHAGHVRPSAALVGADVFLTLSAAAPWLFGGLAGALVIAFVRGLPQCVRELRAELLGSIVRQ